MITKDESITLKGIAIALVVVSHIMSRILSVSSQNFNYLGTGGVGLFLFLSGYGLYCSYLAVPKLTAYWEKKVQKVFIPYWIITFIYFFVLDLSPLTLLKNLLFIDYQRNIDPTMWYMSLLIIWYLLFYLLFKININDPIKILFLFFVGFWLFHSKKLFGQCAWQFEQNAFSFPIGVLFSLVVNKFRNKFDIKFDFRFYTFTTIVFGLLYTICYLNNATYQILSVILCVLLISMVKLSSCLHTKTKNSPFDMLGRYSYIIYLIEWKLFDIMPLNYNAFINLAIYFGGILLLILVYRFIEDSKERFAKIAFADKF